MSEAKPAPVRTPWSTVENLGVFLALVGTLPFAFLVIQLGSVGFRWGTGPGAPYPTGFLLLFGTVSLVGWGLLLGGRRAAAARRAPLPPTLG